MVSIIDLDEGIEVAPKYARADGTFEFDLINERNYRLVIQGDDIFRFEEFFFLDGDKTFEGVLERVSSKFEFSSLEFENGKSEILPEMHDDLQKVIDFLIDHTDFKLNVDLFSHFLIISVWRHVVSTSRRWQDSAYIVEVSDQPITQT